MVSWQLSQTPPGQTQRILHTNMTELQVCPVYYISLKIWDLYFPLKLCCETVFYQHIQDYRVRIPKLLPQTALKVILSRSQPYTVTVQVCMHEIKYSHLLTLHRPSTAQSSSKQFCFPVATETLMIRYTVRVQYIQKPILYV
jgi:hypothetical protein